MKQSIGTTFMLNIIIVFLVVTFALLSATLSYYKAYKINNRIEGSIEKYEGYNNLSKPDIEKILKTLGYNPKTSCPATRNGASNISSSEDYCIYLRNTKGYDYYTVVTYLNMEIPVIGQFLKIPVVSETEKIYVFSEV